MNLLKLILPAVFSCCLTTCARAETSQKAATQPISYVQPVPSFAKRMMPTQGRSLFWGKLTAESEETATGLHLYALYAPELKVKRSVQYHLALDVFTLTPKPQLLNRAFVVYKYLWAPTAFGMSFAWLDPKVQSTPLVVVRSFAKGDFGPLGIEHFVAFPKGWKSQPNVINLNFGAWRASDISGEVNRLVLGQDDLVEIHSFLSPATGEASPEQITRNYTFTSRWSWGLQKFTPQAQDPTVLERYFTPYQ